jgi:hypothetical protein
MAWQLGAENACLGHLNRQPNLTLSNLQLGLAPCTHDCLLLPSTATTQCKKVVWMGPKSYAAISLLEGLFTDGKTHPTPLQSTRNKEDGSQGA